MESSFKKNLRDELDFQDIKVKELSAMTGIPKPTLDSYLGVRQPMPPADVAVKIAQDLNVSVEYLVTGNKNTTPNSPEEMLVNNFHNMSESNRRNLLKISEILK